MADRLNTSLVLSNIALVIAVIALIVAAFLPGPSAPTTEGRETAPPLVALSAGQCPVGVGCWLVTVTNVSAARPLWRFSASLYVSASRIVDPPAALVGTGTLYYGLWENLYVNFSDADGDGQLSVGDQFHLERLNSGSYYAVRIFWAATGHQIQQTTFAT